MARPCSCTISNDVVYAEIMESKSQQEMLKIPIFIDFVFVFVGRLVQDKGVAELVAAFLQLVATQSHCRLLLVGPFEPALDPLPAATLAAIEATPEIVCVGWQDDVRPYFSISTALVFPSYREGFPNVVLQAGAMGLPSIVSAINGCNEIILPGLNGVLVPSKDMVSLYEALKRFATDADFCLHLQSHARELILSRYEQEVVWAALLDEYHRVIQ